MPFGRHKKAQLNAWAWALFIGIGLTSCGQPASGEARTLDVSDTRYYFGRASKESAHSEPNFFNNNPLTVSTGAVLEPQAFGAIHTAEGVSLAEARKLWQGNQNLVIVQKVHNRQFQSVEAVVRIDEPGVRRVTFFLPVFDGALSPKAYQAVEDGWHHGFWERNNLSLRINQPFVIPPGGECFVYVRIDESFIQTRLPHAIDVTTAHEFKAESLSMWAVVITKGSLLILLIGLMAVLAAVHWDKAALFFALHLVSILAHTANYYGVNSPLKESDLAAAILSGAIFYFVPITQVLFTRSFLNFGLIAPWPDKALGYLAIAGLGGIPLYVFGPSNVANGVLFAYVVVINVVLTYVAWRLRSYRYLPLRLFLASFVMMQMFFLYTIVVVFTQVSETAGRTGYHWGIIVQGIIIFTAMVIKLRVERKHAREFRAFHCQREAEYKKAMGFLPGAVYIDSLGEQPQMLYMSPSIEGLLGVDPYILMLARPERTVLPEDAHILEELNRRFKETDVHEGEAMFRVRTMDRKIKWVRISYRRNPDLGGLPVINGFVVDLTDLKQAKDSLETYKNSLEQTVALRTDTIRRTLQEVDRSRETVLSIVQAVHEILIVVDEDHQVVMLNGAAQTILSTADFKPFTNRTPLSGFGMTGRKIAQLIARRSDHGMAEIELQVNGQTRTYRLSTEFIRTPSEDAFSGIVILMVDVTDQKEMQQLKDDFISTAAHELRTPLTSITGFSELMLTRNDLSEAQKKKFVGYIYDKAIALRRILNQLLDIQMIESGGSLVMEWSPVSISQFMQNYMASFKDANKGIHCEFIPPSKETIIRVDRQRVEQALDNVFSNALKYAQGKPEIRIDTAQGADFVDIRISDNGIGMSKEQLTRVFEKFYRADTSNVSIEGAGLGMTIVTQIMEMHGGSCFVDSELGQGTTVTLRFPYAE